MSGEPKSNLAVYEEWKPDDAVGAAETVAAAAESGSYWKPKAGQNVVRVLPTRRGLHPHPLVETWGHYIEVPGQENGVGFCCPRKMKAGWLCPACVKVDELRATGNPADYEAAGNYMAKLRVYACIIDRSDEGAGVQVFAFGKTIYEPLMAYRSRDPREDEPFTNVDDTGSDVVLTKTGEKLKTKYGVRLSKRHSPLSEDAALVQQWLEGVRDLRGETRVLSTKDILAKLSGEGRRGEGRGDRPRGGARSVVDDSDDSDDRPPPAPRRPSPGAAPAAVPYVLHEDD